MAYTIINMRRLPVGRGELHFPPKARKRITDEQFEALKRDKVLGALLREGLLGFERVLERAPGKRAPEAPSPSPSPGTPTGAPRTAADAPEAPEGVSVQATAETAAEAPQGGNRKR